MSNFFENQHFEQKKQRIKLMCM